LFCLLLALALLSVNAAAPMAAATPLATTVINFPVGSNLRQYGPRYVLIHVGDTVEWDGPFQSHPLASDDGLWTTVSSGSTFSYTFNQAGAFRFYCMIHGGPGGTGMSGEVFVSSTPILTTFLPLALR
jgi:plastocyanin